jgi:hypothetical protein
LETDQTLFEATAGYSDDESAPNEVESSEGEDWDDGNTLVSKFMDVDLEQVLFPFFFKWRVLTRFYVSSGPKNTDDVKINLVESLQGQHCGLIDRRGRWVVLVPFGQKNASLKKDLMNVLVPTLDRIKQAHDEITDAKGPERRMEYVSPDCRRINTDETHLFREGAQKFLQYTPEFTRKVEKSQADYEQAHAKCQASPLGQAVSPAFL